MKCRSTDSEKTCQPYREDTNWVVISYVIQMWPHNPSIGKTQSQLRFPEAASTHIGNKSFNYSLPWGIRTTYSSSLTNMWFHPSNPQEKKLN